MSSSDLQQLENQKKGLIAELKTRARGIYSKPTGTSSVNKKPSMIRRNKFLLQRILMVISIVVFSGLTLITAIYNSFSKPIDSPDGSTEYCTSMLTTSQKGFSWLVIWFQMIINCFFTAYLIILLIYDFYKKDKSCRTFTGGFAYFILIVIILIINMYIIAGFYQLFTAIYDSNRTEETGISCTTFKKADDTCSFLKFNYDYAAMRNIIIIDWTATISLFIFFSYKIYKIE